MAKATPDSAMARNRPWSIETHGIDAIGGEERRGKPSDTFWVWFAANISVLGVTYGGYLVIFYGLDLWQTVVAAVVGVVASFLLVGLISLAGKRAGAPTMVLSRAPFGVIGNGLPALVSYVTLVGFEIVLASLAALAIRTVLTRLGAASSTGELAVGFVMVVALAVAVSLFGQATIQRVLTWFTAAFGALTLVFMALEARQVDWRKVAALPHGNLLAGLLGGLSIIMAGTGLTWTNTAADYSRYLPRSVSSRGVVWWTTFGASLPLVALIVFGGLLAANDASVATSSDPIGVLAAPLPTWFLIPYMITAVGGLVAEVVMSSYSGGLNLLTLGLRTARHKSILLDSVLVASGSIYILFFSPSFFAPFEGFLVTMGAALASWAAIFLVDLWVFRRGGYVEADLYDSCGSYGSVNLAGVSSLVLGTALGWGLLTSTSPAFAWTGYLLGMAGGPKGPVGASSIGLLCAFVVAGLLYALLSRPRISASRTAESAV
ncbi:MAG: cytosine permease [Actinomycetota bacterium]|nr:cytosine permease [Actinomycetota bacterium]